MVKDISHNVKLDKGIEANQQHFHYIHASFPGPDCLRGEVSGLSGEAIGDLADHDLGSSGSGALSSNACS